MIRKFFAGSIMLAILVIAPALSFAYAILGTYLNLNFYTNKNVVENVYEVITSYMATSINYGAMQQSGEDIIDEEEIEAQLKELISTEDLMEITTSIVNQLKQEPLPETLEINISGIKEHLPEISAALMQNLVENLEPCTAEQEVAFTMESETMPMCIPSMYTKEDIQAEIKTFSSPEVFDAIPNTKEIDLSQIPLETRYLIGFVIQKNSILRIGIAVIYLLLIGLMGLVIFKPADSVLKWIGNGFFWSALPLALINPTIAVALDIAAKSVSATEGIDMATTQKTLEFINTFISFVTANVMWQGIIFTIIGLVLFILGAFVIKNKE